MCSYNWVEIQTVTNFNFVTFSKTELIINKEKCIENVTIEIIRKGNGII
jgi:hypothetical protein